jgi:hypothetical protein
MPPFVMVGVTKPGFFELMTPARPIVNPSHTIMNKQLQGLVLARFLRAVDHQYLYWRFLRFEFQTRLLL